MKLLKTIVMEGTERNNHLVQISSKIWESLNWKAEDKLELTTGQMYDDSGCLSHQTITLERVKDVNKNKRRSKK
jgi:hypothetical protein